MITYSIIQKSQLEGAHRLDAEYYQPEYLRIRKNIEDMGFLNFGDIIISFNSGKNLSQTDDSKFTKFIRTQNVRPIIIDNDGMSFTQEKKYSKLSYGDLLFVRVGEGVGNSSVVTKSFQDSTCSDNVIKIRIKDMNPFYVSVLLNSKIGFLLMEQIKKGSARSLVSRENFNSLRIPKLTTEQQIYFENAVYQAERIVIESSGLYSQAENLFLEELELKDFKKKDALWSIVKLSEVKNANRIDAEYFQIAYEKLLARIKEKNGRPLGDIVSIKKGIEPGAESYLGEGKKFIRVSNMSKFGINDADQKYISEDLYKKLRDDFEPKVGEILLTKDATPGIAFVLSDAVAGIVAGGIVRLQLKDKNIEDEYLALCLNSVVGKMQAERDAGGSVIAHWRPEQIKNVLIPVLPKPIQQKIAGLVRQSREARKKSKELLEAAKQKVEEAIEKK